MPLKNIAYLRLFRPSKVNQLLGGPPVHVSQWENEQTRDVPPFSTFADLHLGEAARIIGRPKGPWPSRSARSNVKRKHVVTHLSVHQPDGTAEKWLKYVQKRLCLKTRRGCAIGPNRVFTYPNIRNAASALPMAPQLVTVTTHDSNARPS